MKTPALKIFSILFGVAYTVCFYIDWSLFRYYPEVREFHLFPHANLGPPILWYGWIASAAILSGALAMMVPRRWAERLWHGWVWLVPLVVIVLILIYERRWFV